MSRVAGQFQSGVIKGSVPLKIQPVQSASSASSIDPSATTLLKKNVNSTKLEESSSDLVGNNLEGKADDNYSGLLFSQPIDKETYGLVKSTFVKPKFNKGQFILKNCITIIIYYNLIVMNNICRCIAE